MAEVRALADEHGLAIHLDGARVFNAAVALGVAPSLLARDADSVSFCLSKGLSAPVGSLACGSAEFIQRARRQRKLLGGGMRQAGILAAAGTVALETMIDRLAEDHANARRLAEGLSQLPKIEIDPERVQTNIVIFALTPDALSPAQLAQGLAGHGVKVGTIGERRIRAVTHHGIAAQDVDNALTAFRDVLQAGG
jgi:threonine aldolase